MYRYLNPGYIDLFKNTPGTSYTQITDSTKTKTGIGFTNDEYSEMSIIGIPTGTKELWIKLDFYAQIRSKLFYLRIKSDNTICGIGSHSTWGGVYNQTLFINGSSTSLSYEQTPASIATYLFHIKSDATDGVFECIRDGVTLFSQTGDILHGDDIIDVTCSTISNSTDCCISNIIVSDTPIEITERVMAVPCNITTDMTDNGDGTYTATALNQYLRFGIDSSIATTLASGTKITGASLAARSCIRDGEGIETLEAYDGATLLGSDSIPTTEKTGASVGVTLDNTVSQFLTHNYELRAK